MTNTTSIIVLIIQIGCITALAFTGKIIPEDTFLRAIAGLALVFFIWAVVQMKFRFNVFPELIPGKELVTSGPYRYSRHPLYAGIIIITLVWLLDLYTITRFIIWAVLIIDLSYKINLEESILKNKFPSYVDYMKKTKKIIPFLY